MDSSVREAALIRGKRSEKHDVDLINELRSVLCAVGRYDLSTITTDDSDVPIWQSTMPVGSSWTITFTAAAFDGTNAAGWKRMSVLKCTAAGGIVFVGSGALDVAKDAVGWAITVSLSAPQTAQVVVKGGIGETVKWKVHVEVVEAF